MRFIVAGAALATIMAVAQPAPAQQGRDRKGGAEKPSAVQEKKGPKRYTVTSSRAVVITRDVLVRQGFLVERVVEDGDVTVVWYRRGNMGKGKGKGPLEKLVIRRVEKTIVFEQAPPEVLIDIDIRLKL